MNNSFILNKNYYLSEIKKNNLLKNNLYRIMDNDINKSSFFKLKIIFLLISIIVIKTIFIIIIVFTLAKKVIQESQMKFI